MMDGMMGGGMGWDFSTLGSLILLALVLGIVALIKFILFSNGR